MPISKTVVISCAGMGKRLGLGTSKCLVDVAGEPLIIRNLKMLDDVDDVRVVVGYQAERVIEVVTGYRRDVTFVFNHDYARTNTGDSVRLAANHANEYILTIDGDLLVHPDDMKKILAAEGEFVGVTAPGTDNPVLADVEEGTVTAFSREKGSFEWTGVTQVKTQKILNGAGHTYQLIEPHLPMPYIYLRTKEIDTPNDYDNAVRWVKGGYSDEVVLGIVGGTGSYATVDYFRRVVDSFRTQHEWERPRVVVDNRCTMPSESHSLQSGEKHAELVRQLSDSVRGLVDGGCTHIVLACGALYACLDELRAIVPEASRYVIDMIDLLANDVQRRGIKKVLLLAPEGTIATGIYQACFEGHGVDVGLVNGAMLAELEVYIELVRQSKVDEDARGRFAAFVRSLNEPNVILGCPELPVLVNDDRALGVELFDPLQTVIDFVKAVHNRSKTLAIDSRLCLDCGSEVNS